MNESRRPFYRGETIDLVVPAPHHLTSSSWADWLNDELTTRFTTHGLMPNSVNTQARFLESLDNGDRFALLITPKGNDQPIGVVSLASIDYRKGSCALAIIMDLQTEQSHSPLAALEAVALVTTHAFDKLGMRRIDAGQVFPEHERWRKSLELLGYRAEGIRRDAFKRGYDISDEVMLGCRYNVYFSLKSQRGGKLWTSVSDMTDKLAKIPKQSFAQVLDAAIRVIESNYFKD